MTSSTASEILLGGNDQDTIVRLAEGSVQVLGTVPHQPGWSVIDVDSDGDVDVMTVVRYSSVASVGVYFNLAVP